MAHDQQRAFRSVALQSGDNIRARRIFRDDYIGDAFVVEDLLQIIDDPRLVAGRVGGIDAHKCLEVAHRFVVDFGPVGSLRRSLKRTEKGTHQQMPHGISVASEGGAGWSPRSLNPQRRIYKGGPLCGSRCPEVFRIFV